MIGQTISHYTILDKIGQGGMGEVFVAHDTSLDRKVAIKILPEVFEQDEIARKRFLREAKSAAALDHPFICNIHEVFEFEGKDFIVMEYVEGQTLKDRLAQGPVPLKEAMEWAAEVAEALAVAHEKEIIHRDLKPSNIMLPRTGHTKVMDFGLAKHVAGTEGFGSQEATLTGLTREGTTVGTLPYMSPEQVQGKPVDHRSDLFSLGIVIYEMVTGVNPFRKGSGLDTANAITREAAAPISKHRDEVPPPLVAVINKALEKDPARRYQSASELHADLQGLKQESDSSARAAALLAPGVLLRNALRLRVAIPALIILLLLGGLTSWWVERIAKARWARSKALPEVSRLIDQERFVEAYAVAAQAEKYIPDDPMLGKFWPKISWTATIHTTPPGVNVFRRDYPSSDGAWEFVGHSPIEKYRLPRADFQWRLELKGFVPTERFTVSLFEYILPSNSLSVAMDEEAKAPAGMVHQTDGFGSSGFGLLQKTPVTLLGLPGFEDMPPVGLQDYWLDRYEVTNRQFKDFLDQGGYRKPEYWKHEFRKDNRVLSWTEAMSLFRDATGRLGPASWVQGEYPPGQEDFPVSGVSWYEAAAYAEFVGKALPTLYHWTNAASPWGSNSIMPASNFGRQGPAPVGRHRGMSWCGAYDMAGNVKEWCWNEASPGKRYILGGAWDEPFYMFNDADARSPFQRSANFGFRCAKYPSGSALGKAADPVVLAVRDFNSEKPVSNELFRVYQGFYSYDKTPLRAAVESVEETGDWKREKITFAAAYGGERVIAYLFLPKKSQPPFQTIIHFPGSETIDLRSSATLPEIEMNLFDFMIKSGRAVLFPVFKGTFERGDGLKSDLPDTTGFWRDHVIAWSKDLGRSIDYLETRPEIDRNKLAYQGFSWGGAMGAVLPAVEDRIKVCLLVVPGFNLQKSLPEVDELNFAPQVRVPVLMLNGRFDFFYPVETSQEPMFRLLGTPKEHKRRVVYDTGHNIPRTELIKETLDWLDHYLGPVQ